MAETAAKWPRMARGTEVHKTGPEGGIAWFVSSRTQEGVYWQVTAGHEGAHGPFGMACTCPAGRGFAEREGHPWQRARVCYHVRLVLEAEAADGLAPRPSAPMHPGLVEA